MRRPWIWASIATVVLVIVYFTVSGITQSLLYLLVAVLTAVVVLAGPGRRSDARLGWRMIGLGGC